MDVVIVFVKEMFKIWKEVLIFECVCIMMKYVVLLKENYDEFVMIICYELGKIFEDVKGDVWCGIEVVE